MTSRDQNALYEPTDDEVAFSIRFALRYQLYALKRATATRKRWFENDQAAIDTAVRTIVRHLRQSGYVWRHHAGSVGTTPRRDRLVRLTDNGLDRVLPIARFDAATGELRPRR